MSKLVAQIYVCYKYLEKGSATFQEWKRKIEMGCQITGQEFQQAALRSWEIQHLGNKLLISLCVSVQELRFHFILIFEFSNSEKIPIICLSQFLAISYAEFHSESTKTSLNHSHAKTQYLHIICSLENFLLCY